MLSYLGIAALAIPWFIAGVCMVAAPDVCIKMNDAFMGGGRFRPPDWARDPNMMRRVGWVALALAGTATAIHFVFGV
jgi:hypothetical protein